MAVAVITGSTGLIGAEAVRLFAAKGMDTVGIDNDMRSYFFGKEASTKWSQRRLENEIGNYVHVDADIRDRDAMVRLFSRYGKSIEVVIHAAAQPSHDWAAREPLTDYSINATGTINLLETARQSCPDAPFIFMSTNKVYGDTPNSLPLVELDNRWEIDTSHPYYTNGIDEGMSIDQCLHSLFGASKAAADIMVQEYGRYFGMKTACFRGGCLTGSGHSGTELHGFLAYLVRCAITGKPYTVFGYKGKQVRDNIHSSDLVNCFWYFYQKPRTGGQVYNMGGGRQSNCSMLEAITACEALTGRAMNWSYSETNRSGDHIWWISDLRRFKSHFPEWDITRGIDEVMAELYEGLQDRLSKEAV